MDETLDAALTVIHSDRSCTMLTAGEDGPPRGRAMTNLSAEENSRGVFWFATDRQSRKVAEIRKLGRVILLFREREGQGSVTVQGRAEIIEDAAVRDRFWQDCRALFWPGGKGCEDYVMIRVAAVGGEYVRRPGAERTPVVFQRDVDRAS